MKYRVVMQPDEMACGIACLSTICAYYGIKNLSLAEIRNFAKTDRDGNSIYSLRKAAEKLNLETKAYECSKKALLSDKVNYPMIVHTLLQGIYNHYMVLFEVNEKKVILGDPANGQVEMTWQEFEKIWTKRIILLKPTENFSETKKYKRSYKIIINLILKFKKELIITAIFTGVISAASAVTATFYSNLIDKVLPRKSFRIISKININCCRCFFLNSTIKFNKTKIYNKI